MPVKMTYDREADTDTTVDINGSNCDFYKPV